MEFEKDKIIKNMGIDESFEEKKEEVITSIILIKDDLNESFDVSLKNLGLIEKVVKENSRVKEIKFSLKLINEDKENDDNHHLLAVVENELRDACKKIEDFKLESSHYSFNEIIENWRKNVAKELFE